LHSAGCDHSWWVAFCRMRLPETAAKIYDFWVSQNNKSEKSNEKG